MSEAIWIALIGLAGVAITAVASIVGIWLGIKLKAPHEREERETSLEQIQRWRTLYIAERSKNKALRLKISRLERARALSDWQRHRVRRVRTGGSG